MVSRSPIVFWCFCIWVALGAGRALHGVRFACILCCVCPLVACIFSCMFSSGPIVFWCSIPAFFLWSRACFCACFLHVLSYFDFAHVGFCANFLLLQLRWAFWALRLLLPVENQRKRKKSSQWKRAMRESVESQHVELSLVCKFARLVCTSFVYNVAARYSWWLRWWPLLIVTLFAPARFFKIAWLVVSHDFVDCRCHDVLRNLVLR